MLSSHVVRRHADDSGRRICFVHFQAAESRESITDAREEFLIGTASALPERSLRPSIALASPDRVLRRTDDYSRLHDLAPGNHRDARTQSDALAPSRV